MHVCSSSEGWLAPVCREKRVWEARQVGTAARPAIENVVIAATAVFASEVQSNSSANEEIAESFFASKTI